MKYRFHTGALNAVISIMFFCVLLTPASVRAGGGDGGLIVSGLSQVDFISADAAEGEVDELRLRRLRVGVRGAAAKSMSYNVKFDIDEQGQVDVLDAYTAFAPGGAGARLIIGQHKTPNSFDEQISSSSLSILERAAFTDAIDLDRRLGASLQIVQENFIATTGIFGGNLNGPDVVEQFAAAGRIAYFDSINEKTKVHIGGSWRLRWSTRDRPLRYRALSFDRSGRDFFAEQDHFLGAEAAIIHGRIWLAGEFAHGSAECVAVNASHGKCQFRGGYGEAGIVLGGDRLYQGGEFKKFKIDRPVSKGGTGALVFAYRYDTLSFDAPLADYSAHIVSAHWSPADAVRASVSAFQEMSICRKDEFTLCSDVAFSDSRKRKGVILRLQVGFAVSPL